MLLQQFPDIDKSSAISRGRTANFIDWWTATWGWLSRNGEMLHALVSAKRPVWAKGSPTREGALRQADRSMASRQDFYSKNPCSSHTLAHKTL